jgi:DNA-binding MarR family transcriptional regulator
MSTKNGLSRDRFGGLQGAALFWIHRVDQAVRQQILAGFRARGQTLSAPQWEIMSLLWQRDGLTQTMLSEATGTDKATVTRLVDRMVREALVERRPDPGDRRAFRIYLKEAGSQLHGELLPVVGDVVQRAFDGLEPAEQAALKAALERIFENLTTQDR